ncbi:hypothetical protein QGX11_gp148 [Pseudomonas phage PPSC2]|uniref:Uncharacterized protein n=1 Tax=Pseudomonas phage PPSC2 TaxID=2041350 RepID=A0A2R2YAW0_9CAUD|nr:hypothetical protein QGX11_gp148 [Pseudomonas phage PPSC2]ATN92911.1 hypothetical protein PPSC2_148 [Pseudomonas phage PPSC2]
MARILVDSEMKNLPPIKPGTLMIHNDPHPPLVVMATGIEMGDEFPGVDLETGAYGEQWISTEFRVFEGKITLEN